MGITRHFLSLLCPALLHGASSTDTLSIGQRQTFRTTGGLHLSAHPMLWEALVLRASGARGHAGILAHLPASHAQRYEKPGRIAGYLLPKAIGALGRWLGPAQESSQAVRLATVVEEGWTVARGEVAAEIGFKERLQRLFYPPGEVIGEAIRGKPLIRTVSPAEAERIIDELMAIGAHQVPKATYQGRWYQLSNGQGGWGFAQRFPGAACA